MIDLAEAHARLLALKPALEAETLPLAEAARRWAAAPLSALRTQPEADLSAMDGYAIRFGDLPGPWRVIGESAAGAPFAGEVGAGEAARIFTGAHVPAGADAILIQEEATRDGDTLRLAGDGPPAPGWSIRPAGMDFAEGVEIVAAGERLTPARIALAIVAGLAEAAVRRRARVALISTGDELRVPGDLSGLPASNAAMLAAQLATLPVDATDLGIVRDDRAALARAFTDAARRHDVIVVTGGASVGDHDLVRPALVDAGATLDFWRIAIRPGKPVLAGTLGEAVVLGLPGNPVSAFVTAELLLKPLIAHLGGARDPLPRRIAALTGADLPAVAGRADFVRAAWRGGTLIPVGASDSAALSPLAAADAMIVRAAHAEALPASARVEAIIIA